MNKFSLFWHLKKGRKKWLFTGFILNLLLLFCLSLDAYFRPFYQHTNAFMDSNTFTIRTLDKEENRTSENILSSNYADGTQIDVWLCSNDSTALGVENALAANYNGEYPIITGQDCDIENVKNMIAGKQSMSIFKDTRTLASQVVKMVGQILNGETVDVNDTETYDNGTGVIPSYLCEPVFADVNNYKELLIDSGYYAESDLQ